MHKVANNKTESVVEKTRQSDDIDRANRGQYQKETPALYRASASSMGGQALVAKAQRSSDSIC